MSNQDPKYQEALLMSYRRETHDLRIKLSSEKVKRRNAEAEVRKLREKVRELERRTVT